MTVENKADATVEKAKDVKANTENQVKADAKATKQAANSIKPKVNASTEVKSETKVSATKQ